MDKETRQDFATSVNADLLAALRAMAQSEGRQVASLVDEAFADLIEKRQLQGPREQVMSVYQASHEIFGPLYKKLAE